MQLKWTSKANSDLVYLYGILAIADRQAAARAVRVLTKAPDVLLSNPDLGEKIFAFEPREIRSILGGRYEVRYEIRDTTLYILRLWHTHEIR
ncbi:type II toxin-antitoxin system RelE/ParE family toxin [Advenella kashmirensis]